MLPKSSAAVAITRVLCGTCDYVDDGCRQDDSAGPSRSSLTVCSNAVVTCEIILFQNYFMGLSQLMNIIQHVQCR